MATSGKGTDSEEKVVIKSGGTIGQLEHFDTSKPETWTSYLERFEFFFFSFDVDSDQKKIASLVTMGGPDAYHILTGLAAPEKVNQLTYTQITEKLTAFFVPKPSGITRFFEFFKRDQLPDEKYANYLAELQRISNDCEFGNLLDKMLVRRFICGIRDEALQRRFLQEDETKLTKRTVLDTATAAENPKIH